MNGQMHTLDEVRLQADAVDLDGTNGGDLLIGTDGIDTLSGLGGDDTLRGGAGGDVLDGGAGWDVADYTDATRSVRVDLQNPAISYNDAAGDTFTSIEAFRTGNTVDQLRGDAGDNHFSGGGLTDRLYGRAGNDTLRGGEGADAIYGGLGADVMTGGPGAGRMDRFIYFNAAETGAGPGNRDLITDFTPGEDRIEISRIDADITQGFKQRFDFIGDAAFSGTAGELRFDHDAGRTIVQADRDGDGTADFEILLTGTLTLSATDFLI
ncbi:calcium-binding protein [Pseudaestuariivita atlantica]|uniref:calcium-binding protein n=1 Tax=Pseudaestuariivita atlantica TaxID=1317121 RepID=UPI00067B12A3|nr:M10 family metallopeptidase C-terminal domain-containing protein [Pseudaestuariivita atlantica]